jgi:mono/diheme cytochrome c family protein
VRRWLLPLALLLAAGAFAAAPEAGRARVDYMLNCQGCHLPDGSGYPGKVPDLRHSMGRFLVAEGGREFLVRVPGAATSALADAQLAEVLNWMLAEFCGGDVPGGFVAYEAAEVGRLRSRPLIDVQTVRSALAARTGVPAAY